MLLVTGSIIRMRSSTAMRIDRRIIRHWHSLPLSELGSASVISALTNWPIKLLLITIEIDDSIILGTALELSRIFF